MKTYTDLEQSKKLAEILALESADMYYYDVPVRKWVDKTDTTKGTHIVFESQIFAIENLPNHKIGEGGIPAWSLAALLNILPVIIGNISETGALKLRMDKGELDFNIWYENIDNGFVADGLDVIANNAVDTCYGMILKLYERKIL